MPLKLFSQSGVLESFTRRVGTADSVGQQGWTQGASLVWARCRLQPASKSGCAHCHPSGWALALGCQQPAHTILHHRRAAAVFRLRCRRQAGCCCDCRPSLLLQEVLVGVPALAGDGSVRLQWEGKQVARYVSGLPAGLWMQARSCTPQQLAVLGMPRLARLGHPCWWQVKLGKESLCTCACRCSIWMLCRNPRAARPAIALQHAVAGRQLG